MANKKNLTYLITTTILLFFINHAFGQDFDFTFKHLNNKDGLSNSIVNCIFQDHKGYIWIGTDDGLNQYDGYEFVVHYSSTIDKNSLWSNRIESIYEDEQNNLWVGSGHGLNKYNRDKNNFTRIQFNTNTSKPEENRVRAITEDNSNLWFAIRGAGLLRYQKQNKKFKSYTHQANNDQSVSINELYAVFNDSKNRLWIGTREEGVSLFDKATETFTNIRITPYQPAFNRVRCIFELRENVFLLGTDGGLVQFSYFNNRPIFKFFSHNASNKNIGKGHVRDIFKDSKGNIWIASQNSLTIFNEVDESFTAIKSDKKNALAISGNEIWDIFQDDQGLVWFGTYKAGISILNLDQNQFVNWKDNISNAGLNNTSVIAITENEDGNIWVSVDHGGLCLFTPDGEVIEKHINQPKNNKSISSNAILSICIDQNKNLWTGQYAGGLCKKVNGGFQTIIPSGISETDWHIWDVIEDHKGRIWTASMGEGINYYEPLNGKFTTFKKDEFSNDSMTDNSTWCLFEDSKNQIWVGSSKGLYRYNENSQSFTYYPYKSQKEEVLSYGVFSIYEDTKGQLWVATEGFGLNYFNPLTGLFHSFTSTDGLPNNVVYGILEDGNHNLWISTNNGVSCITLDDDLRLKSVSNYNTENGVFGTQFNRGAYYKSSNGKLYFGHTEGMVFFNPDSMKTNTIIPKLVFTNFKILNQSVVIGSNDNKNTVLSKHISETKAITLNHKQTVFSIEFAALNYISTHQNTYAYKLDGFDKDWNYVGTKREATYTNLDAGSYTFYAKGANNDGIWNETPILITINILPPWWETWLFKIVLVLAVITVLIVFINLRMKSLKHSQILLEQKVNKRTLELQKANRQLEKQKEEIKSKSENLTQLNGVLTNQKEELESTLKVLQQTQSQLIQSEKMSSFSTLTAGIAHEINNPLNYIQCGKLAINDYVMAHCKEHTHKITPLIEIIDSGIKKAANIIQSLGKINQNKNKQHEMLDIHAIIENCIELLTSKNQNTIDIESDLCNQQLTFLGNESEIYQIIISLIENGIDAIKKISEKGKITISTKNENQRVIMTICDSGCGIPQAEIKRITDPFYTSKSPGQGTGLGLYTTYTIVENHKGSMHFQSELNKGTCVTLAFPEMLGS